MYFNNNDRCELKLLLSINSYVSQLKFYFAIKIQIKNKYCTVNETQLFYLKNVNSKQFIEPHQRRTLHRIVREKKLKKYRSNVVINNYLTSALQP